MLQRQPRARNLASFGGVAQLVVCSDHQMHFDRCAPQLGQRACSHRRAVVEHQYVVGDGFDESQVLLDDDEAGTRGAAPT